MWLGDDESAALPRLDFRRGKVNRAGRDSLGRDEGGDSGAEAIHGIMPKLPAGKGIESIHVAIHGDDQKVAFKQQADVAGALGCLPIPHDVAGVASECGDAAVEAGKYEIGQFHEPVDCRFVGRFQVHRTPHAVGYWRENACMNLPIMVSPTE